MDHQGTTTTFREPLAGEQHGHFGDYGVIANGSRGDLRVDFSHVPNVRDLYNSIRIFPE